MNMNFLHRNLFAKLRAENFSTGEQMEPMTHFKHEKINRMMDNIQNMPPGSVEFNNYFLNKRFVKLQNDERHAIDTSVETLYLLRLIVGNINGMLSYGISLRGIVQLGNYLRTRGDKVDFVKLENWLRRLHIRRMAQLQGSILMRFFNFEQDELPFVRHVEKGAYRLTLQALYFNIKDKREIKFEQNNIGLVQTQGTGMRKQVFHSMRYFPYAPLETTSGLFRNVTRSLSELEE
ncbi:MAG: hypothetical protein UFJ02_06020 [Prevotella sp.]|nr:hypothetical protein [Prevotella sp.]